MTPSTLSEPGRLLRHDAAPVTVAFVGATLAGVALISSYAILNFAVDALSALLVLGPAFLLGVCILPLLGLKDLPPRWRVLLAAALGIGTLSLLVLLLGLAGFLTPTLWLPLLFMFSLAGVLRLRVWSVRTQGRPLVNGHWPLWLILVPFAVLAILAASYAPGFLWAEEGFGYDILEYHLQMPKEYYESGRIAYAPRNVYANFPANVEMLYLLTMVVHGDVYDVATVANLIHLLLGVLAVYAAWMLGAEWSPLAGLAAALGIGTVGWLGYLSGLAYVENGILFFGTASLAAAIRAASVAGGPQRMRWLVVGGLLAGFACGCKYTAVAMIAIPIAVGVLLLIQRARQRFSAVLVYLLGCAVTFSPWLIKNAAMTGNPVFPLANSVFRAYPRGWGIEEQARWDHGHSIPGAEYAVPARLRALLRHTLADHDQRIGPAIIGLALAGLAGRRLQRIDAFLLIFLAIQVCVWLGWTHLYARFAVPILIPLAVLLARAIGSVSARRARFFIAAIVVGAAWNLAFEVRMYRREAVGGAMASVFYDGHAPGFEYLAAVNRELPQHARLLMLGDARAFYIQRRVDYTVVFNRNPVVEALQQSPDAASIVDWLRRAGYSHVLIHWAEIERLRRTYGFSERVTPELFANLASEGLSLVRDFPHPTTGRRYVELYEVRPAGASEPVPDGP